jgi:hypothetical protein
MATVKGDGGGRQRRGDLIVGKRLLASPLSRQGHGGVSVRLPYLPRWIQLR